MKNNKKTLLIVFFTFVYAHIYPYRKFVLTGAPGSGKSTVIQELSDRGFQTIPEAYTTLYTEAQNSNALTDFFNDPLKLRFRLMQKQQQLEDTLNNTSQAFLDRGTHDIILFGKHLNITMPPSLFEEALKSSYDLIFLLAPLSQEYYQQTDIRRESAEESQTIYNLLKEEYKKLGYTVIDVPFDTPQKRAQYILDTINKKYFYADIIDCFAGKNNLYTVQEFVGPVKLIEFRDKHNTLYRFFGVHKNKQIEVNFHLLKHKISHLLQLSPLHTVQVIGDSNRFSSEGTEFARRFLKDHLDRSSSLIEYGFTGYKTSTEFDVNSLVSEYADHYKQGNRILANIVGHTHTAINKWGTSGAQSVHNFMVVYNDVGMTQEPLYNTDGIKIGGFTTFGDDVIMSDFLLNAGEHDFFICLEGGAQSFKQLTNALRLNIPVHCVFNLRKAENELFFSTARFLYAIDNAFHDNIPPTKAQVHEIYRQYSQTLKSMWDASRPDHKTKKQLFENAINEFIEENTYHRVHALCSFTNAQLPQ